MSFPIIPRLRSNAPGHPDSLFLGELAVNTQDGSLYLGSDQGVAKINAVGVVSSTLTEWVATEGQTVFVGINGYVDTSDGAYIVSVGGVDQPGSVYAITAANGGTLTLSSGVPAGVIVSVRAFVGGTGGQTGGTNATQLQGRNVGDDAAINAQQDAGNAYSSANQAQSTANQAQSSANQAQSTANQAASDAATAQNAANQAQSTANQAASDAAAALVGTKFQNSPIDVLTSKQIYVAEPDNSSPTGLRFSAYDLNGLVQSVRQCVDWINNGTGYPGYPPNP